jgi:hypothetical protein
VSLSGDQGVTDGGSGWAKFVPLLASGLISVYLTFAFQGGYRPQEYVTCP